MAAPQSHINAPVDIGTLYNEAASPTSPIGQLYNSFGPASGTAKAMSAVTPPSSSTDPITSGTFKGVSSQQLSNYFATLPGPTMAQLSGSNGALGQTDPRGRSGGNAAQYNLSPQQQQFMDSVARSGWSQPGAFDSFMSKVTPIITAAGVGAAFGPEVFAGLGGGGAAGAANVAATGSFGAGTLGTAGTVGLGATTGAITGGTGAALTGKNIGKGALVGGLVGGAGAALRPAVGALTGLTGTTGNIVNGALAKAGTGALSSALSGQSAAAGAAGGALSGAGGAAGGAIAGSIFNSGDTVPTSNSTDIPSSGNTNMSVDPSYFDTANIQPIPMDTGYGGGYNPASDPNAGAFSGGAGLPGSTDPTAWDALGGLNPNYQVSNSYLNSGAGGGSGAGAQAGGSLLSGLAGKLSSLFGGNISPGMMQSLLGTLASGGASYLNSNAAKGAANTFAGQTKFSPYGVNTGLGSTSFNGTNATQTLSPQEQAIQKMLGGVADSSGAALAAGPGATQTADFNSLQSGDLQAQQRLLGNTQDNEFSRGILGSTAGGYQTQAALNAIGNQTSQNQVTAQNMAQNQQQQQLAQLTGSLNGMSGINSQQLQQILAGFGGAQAASNANDAAYSPSLAANSNTPIGKLLGTIGNQASTTPFVNPTGP